MEIELLVVSDCPQRPAAVDLLRTALVDIGLRPEFRVVTVSDDEDSSFPGSPTFRADGNDLFPTTGPRAGLSCRLYRSGPTGGLPELSALRRALKRAADQARTASTA
jgi:hypothetical protein